MYVGSRLMMASRAAATWRESQLRPPNSINTTVVYLKFSQDFTALLSPTPLPQYTRDDILAFFDLALGSMMSNQELSSFMLPYLKIGKS